MYFQLLLRTFLNFHFSPVEREMFEKKTIWTAFLQWNLSTSSLFELWKTVNIIFSLFVVQLVYFLHCQCTNYTEISFTPSGMDDEWNLRNETIETRDKECRLKLILHHKNIYSTDRFIYQEREKREKRRRRKQWRRCRSGKIKQMMRSKQEKQKIETMKSRKSRWFFRLHTTRMRRTIHEQEKATTDADWRWRWNKMSEEKQRIEASTIVVWIRIFMCSFQQSLSSSVAFWCFDFSPFLFCLSLAIAFEKKHRLQHHRY